MVLPPVCSYYETRGNTSVIQKKTIDLIERDVKIEKKPEKVYDKKTKKALEEAKAKLNL